MHVEEKSYDRVKVVRKTTNVKSTKFGATAPPTHTPTHKIIFEFFMTYHLNENTNVCQN